MKRYDFVLFVTLLVAFATIPNDLFADISTIPNPKIVETECPEGSKFSKGYSYFYDLDNDGFSDYVVTVDCEGNFGSQPLGASTVIRGNVSSTVPINEFDIPTTHLLTGDEFCSGEDHTGWRHTVYYNNLPIYSIIVCDSIPELLLNPSGGPSGKMVQPGDGKDNDQSRDDAIRWHMQRGLEYQDFKVSNDNSGVVIEEKLETLDGASIILLDENENVIKILNVSDIESLGEGKYLIGSELFDNNQNAYIRIQYRSHYAKFPIIIKD